MRCGWIGALPGAGGRTPGTGSGGRIIGSVRPGMPTLPPAPLIGLCCGCCCCCCCCCWRATALRFAPFAIPSLKISSVAFLTWFLCFSSLRSRARSERDIGPPFPCWRPARDVFFRSPTPPSTSSQSSSSSSSSSQSEPWESESNSELAALLDADCFKT